MTPPAERCFIANRHRPGPLEAARVHGVRGRPPLRLGPAAQTAGSADGPRAADAAARAQPPRHRPRRREPSRAAAPTPRARTVDGTYNDLDEPAMGMIGARFGRNVPLDQHLPRGAAGPARPEPAPRQPRAAHRDEFKPATIVNVLAGAWLQFEVHDWFSHGKNAGGAVRARARRRRPLERAADADRAHAHRPVPGRERRRRDLRTDRLALVGRLADLRQRAGDRRARSARARAASSGSTRTDSFPRPRREGRPDRRRRQLLARPCPLHTLFSREHDAIADRLAREHPKWTDDQLYDKARLINAALMAKIHTVEWTTRSSRTRRRSYGHARQLVGPPGERLRKRSKNEVIGGIPGSRPTTTASPTR